MRGHPRRCRAAAPPSPGTEAPSKWGCGPGTAPEQTMRESGARREEGAAEPGTLGGRPFIPACPRVPPRPGGPGPQPPLGGAAVGEGPALLAGPLLKSQNFPQLRQLSCALTVWRPGLPRGPSPSSSAASSRRKTIGGRSPGGGDGLRLRRPRREAGTAVPAEPRSFSAAAPAPRWP